MLFFPTALLLMRDLYLMFCSGANKSITCSRLLLLCGHNKDADDLFPGEGRFHLNLCAIFTFSFNWNGCKGNLMMK